MTTDTTSRLTLLAPPEDEALTLGEAKQFLRITHDDEDAVIATAIAAARAAAEDYLRITLLPQEFSYEFTQIAHILPLPVGPAQSIAQVIAYDRDGNATELDSNAYRLSVDGHGMVLPHIPLGHSFAIEFTAGLTQVPAPVKQGMLHHVAAMFEDRGGEAEMPAIARQLYQPYRRVRL